MSEKTIEAGKKVKDLTSGKGIKGRVSFGPFKTYYSDEVYLVEILEGINQGLSQTWGVSDMTEVPEYEIGQKALRYGSAVEVVAGPFKANGYQNWLVKDSDEEHVLSFERDLEPYDESKVLPKVGDKFRVTKNYLGGTDVLVGDILTVIKVDSCGPPCLFTETASGGKLGPIGGDLVGEVLERVTESEDAEEKPKLVVGDRVKVTKDYDGGQFVGSVGELIKIDESDDELPYKVWVGGDEYPVWVCAVEVVTEKQAPKVGDRVKIIRAVWAEDHEGKTGVLLSTTADESFRPSGSDERVRHPFEVCLDDGGELFAAEVEVI